VSFRIGEIVGAYKIVRSIGSGGAGEVFKAEHVITRRIEAIKVLSASRQRSPIPAQRFLREIQIQASLSHPNIASVYTAFWAGDNPVMAMEFVEGDSLRRILQRGRLALGTGLDYARQSLSALAYAHAHGVIHRDISPSNILIARGGRVKLTDFGLAKSAADVRLTQTGAVLGSLYYMSPEQVRASPHVDSRADIYSMGAVLYEIVTGAKACDGDSAFTIMSAQVGHDPRPPIQIEPALPPGLSEIIMKAIAKEPSSRYQSASDFLDALDSVGEIPVSTPVNKGPGPRMSRVWMALAAAIVAALLFRTAKLSPTPQPAVRIVAAATTPKVADTAPASPAPDPAAPKVRSFHAAAAVWAIALSPSGKWLAAGTEDRTIEIWDIGAQQKRATLRGHLAGVTAICFSPDEKWLASGSGDKTVKLWDVHSSAERRVFNQGGLVTSVAFSADGRWLASGSSNRKIKLWELRDSGAPRGFRAKQQPRALAFSPDGRLLAVASDNELELLHVDTGREAQSPRSGGAGALAFGPDAHCLALSVTGRSVALWDAARSRKLRTIESRSPVRATALSRNGGVIALALEGGTISVWK
jgi:tRNA A-37 threonylcarbamoyl transferase component Bud32